MNTKKFMINGIEFRFENYFRKSRNGFAHDTTLFKNGSAISMGTCTYQNRTWEAYEYQSSMLRAVSNYIEMVEEKAIADHKYETGKRRLSADEKKTIKEGAKHRDTMLELAQAVRDNVQESPFKAVGLMAAIGDLLCESAEDKNDWKLRMLKAGVPERAISIPEDWHLLTEEEKERRLNGAIKALTA